MPAPEVEGVADGCRNCTACMVDPGGGTGHDILGVPKWDCHAVYANWRWHGPWFVHDAHCDWYRELRGGWGHGDVESGDLYRSACAFHRRVAVGIVSQRRLNPSMRNRSGLHNCIFLCTWWYGSHPDDECAILSNRASRQWIHRRLCEWGWWVRRCAVAAIRFDHRYRRGSWKCGRKKPPCHRDQYVGIATDELLRWREV